MIWIRLGISCIAFLTIAGSISFGIIELTKACLHIENPILLMTLQKLAFVLYWLPIPLLCACMPRISYSHGEILFSGYFVCATSPTLAAFFKIFGVIWLVGFLSAVIISIVRKQRLSKLAKGNVPVMHQQYLDVFAEYQNQFPLGQVELSQNDLLTSPITIGLIRKQIVLPFADYTQKELRMIYEHELAHIQNRDLFWRMFGLVTAWIHWFNPIIYLQLKELFCQQEIVCDLSIAIDILIIQKRNMLFF